MAQSAERVGPQLQNWWLDPDLLWPLHIKVEQNTELQVALWALYLYVSTALNAYIYIGTTLFYMDTNILLPFQCE